MPVRRHTYNDLRARFRKVIAERERERSDAERLEKERDAEREARRIVRRLLSETGAELRCSQGRVRQVTGLLEAARRDQGAEVVRLAARLERTVTACGRYRAELAGLRSQSGACGARELERSERARKSLAEQIQMLQNANDAMCRELADAAGTLTAHGQDTRLPEAPW